VYVQPVNKKGREELTTYENVLDNLRSGAAGGRRAAAGGGGVGGGGGTQTVELIVPLFLDGRETTRATRRYDLAGVSWMR
jgi:hypothetical protein